jgi:hypothetical protein
VCDESRMLKQNDAIAQNHTKKAQASVAQTAASQA